MDAGLAAQSERARQAAFGLETLVEVHNAGELEWVRMEELEPDILGINNRDIVQREVDDGDVSLTEELISFVPEGWLVLSESAIGGPDDARRAREAGAGPPILGIVDDPFRGQSDLEPVRVRNEWAVSVVGDAHQTLLGRGQQQ